MDYYIEDFIYSINELKDDSELNLYNHLRLCIDVLMHMYFYVQGFKFKNPNGYILENEYLLYWYKRKICELFNIDCNFIYACLRENPEWYTNVRKSAMIGIGHFVETDSFIDFLLK
jgi:hypothetical protein